MVKVTRPIKKDSYLRHRLFDQLDQMRKTPAIWISAPAGSGKTTLISSYVESRKLPCLWYQCDSDDSDPATFFYSMGLAAKGASGKHKPLLLFTPEYQQGISIFTRNYFEQLYKQLKNPSVVVFDNFQDIADSSDFSELLKTALTYLPEGINVIVISRHDPPDVFIRLQANSKMDILRWQDIRLTEEEARGIIHTRTRKLDSEDAIQYLYQMSDGWVVGLVLMVTALKNQQFKTNFTGKHNYEEIIAYFGQEIFHHLDPKTQDFFLRTAFFPRMTARMAMEMTGEPAARNIFQTMNRENYFISRHGHIEPLYEYHPLYRKFLLYQAEKILLPGQLHDVQLKAANLLEQHGQTEAAVSLLREIGDWKMLTSIVLTHAPDMLKQGRHRLLGEWLESIPLDILDANPWLIYLKGMSILPFLPAQAGSALERAFAGFQAASDNIGAMLAVSGVVYAITYQFDDFEQLDHWYAVLNDLASGIDNFPNEDIEASVVSILVVASTLRDISFSETKTWEQRLLKIVETQATISMKVQALHAMLWNRLFGRDAHEALPLLQELQRLSRLREARPLISVAVRSAEVMYYLYTGLHDELMEATQKGLGISRESGVNFFDAWFYVLTAGSFVNRMDEKGAQAWFDKMPPIAHGWPNWSKSGYHLQLMRIALIRKEHRQALYEGKLALDFAARAGSPLAVVNIQLLLAQLFRTMGKREQALGHLEQGRSYAVAKNATLAMIQVLMTEAQFAFDDGDNAQGCFLISKSFALARECDYVFSYCDDPTMTLRMCEKALEEGIEIEHVQDIIRRRGFIPEKSPVHIENWPWPVKVYTMGRFAILINGTPLPPQSKAKQTPLRLLKALIALGGRDIAGDKIVDLLWPDAEGDAAHNALETTLHRLRKLLGYPEAIRLADGKLTLDSRYCWVDAWAFERQLWQADNCKAMEPLRGKELIEKAIALYKGNFFTGERNESWMISRTEHLKSRYYRSIWWLVAYLQGQGQWEQAAQYCEKFLKVDEFREDIYRALMICHKNTGRSSEALLVYERCRKTLSLLLEISPSEETQTIYKAILSNKS